MTKQQDEICYLKSNCLSIPNMRRFSHEAMATTFEVIIVHEDGRYAQQAARAAFDELDRLEAELSRFIANSDISCINNLAANQPLTIGLAAFECLLLSARVYNETSGAFDVTIGSFLNCWQNEDKTPGAFSEEQLNLARQRTGMHLLKLDETRHTVQLLTSPVQIDIGGIGKGYAVDRMAELLREWSIETALISGGYSSVLALDAPPDSKGWLVTLSNPNNLKQTLARLYLQRRAVGASGLQKGRHIIDPRTARPVQSKLALATARPSPRRAAWACADDSLDCARDRAATADALSTAFMIMNPNEIKQYCSRHPEVQALVILQEEEKQPQREKILRFGQWKNLEQI
jgi:thiamine biosynthesis lipoprotein